MTIFILDILFISSPTYFLIFIVIFKLLESPGLLEVTPFPNTSMCCRVLVVKGI